MNRKKLIYTLLLGGLALATALGVVAYRSVNAAVSSDNGNAHPGFRRGFGGGYTNEDLADALGISVDELNTAYQKANDSALAQAVQAGLLTQAQADQLQANSTAFPFGGRWGGWLNQNGIDFEALLADALGITVEKLQAAYSQAFNAGIDRAVAEGSLTQDRADLMKGQKALFASEDFRSAMQSAFEAAVKQAVTAGVITQAQADQILKNVSNMGFGGLPGLGGPPGFGGFEGDRGLGRHGPWGGDAPPNLPPSVAPTTTP